MEAKAILKFAPYGPRKMRGVVDMIRGKSAQEALRILKFSPRHAARVVAKLLQSAIANAVQKKIGDPDDLWVTRAFVDSGPAMKRTQPRARGRAFIIRKRMSHVLLELNPQEGTASSTKRQNRAKQKSSKG